MLPHLETLELHGTLAYLPLIHILEYSSALSTLRKLELSSINNSVISKCCSYIIKRLLLRELELFDISLTFSSSEHIQYLTLPIKHLRFITIAPSGGRHTHANRDSPS
jgi:hypothetical protein